MQTTCKKK